MSEAEDKKVDLPKRSFTAEFWVGVFAIVGCLCFAYLAVNLASIRLTNSGYYFVTAQFTNVSGLKRGAPVEIAGVQIGEVNEISLEDTDAVLVLQIRDGIPLREDDIAQVRTKGIIGDKYIKISPGGSEDIIPNGGKLVETESTVEFEDILGKVIHRLESQ